MTGLPEGFVIREQGQLPQGFVVRGDATKPEGYMGTAIDVAKTIPSTVQRGVAGAVMTLPNLLNLAAAGPQYLYQGVKDTVQGNPTNRGFEPWKPLYSSEDALQMLPEPLKAYDPQKATGKAV